MKLIDPHQLQYLELFNNTIFKILKVLEKSCIQTKCAFTSSIYPVKVNYTHPL